MLPQAARRTTLLSSRHGLSKCYTTPTKKALAAAMEAHQMPSVSSDFPTFIHSSPNAELHSFLKQAARPTTLRPPLPEDKSSPENDFHFPDSATQDLLAVVDTCLYNTYDVPRAQILIERLESASPDDAQLETKLYNSFLEAYITMATEREPEKRFIWLADAWSLYDKMEKGEKPYAPPNATTYAIMLIALHRFALDETSSLYVPPPKVHTLKSTLENLHQRRIKIQHVVSDRVFTSDAEASSIIKLLSKEAAQLSMNDVIMNLSEAEIYARRPYDNPLADIADVNPVRRADTTQPNPNFDSDMELLPKVNLELEEKDSDVPFNLKLLRQHLSDLSLARRVLEDDLTSRQKVLEQSVYEIAQARLERQSQTYAELGIDQNGLLHANLQKLMWSWHVALTKRLEDDVKNITFHEIKARGRGSKKTHIPLSPFLSLVKVERLSLMTILEIMRLQGSGGVAAGMKTARALLALGRAVEQEYKASLCKKNNIVIPSNEHKSTNRIFTPEGYANLQSRRVMSRKLMDDSEQWTAPWTQAVKAKVGSILMEALMDVAMCVRERTNANGTIDKEEQPAFYHSYEYVRGQKLGVIKLNPEVVDRLAKDSLGETLHPRHLPMLVKPRPWTSYNRGGYLFNRTLAMRFKESKEQEVYLKDATDNGNIELIFEGLNILGDTPWKINREIFKVVLEVWNSGERLGKLPPAVYDRPVPEKPQDFDSDFKARNSYLARQKGYTQGKANNHSERCNVNYKIEIARAFLGDTFYQPHNLDFRGRAYPIPPHLNHIGDDLSRGLLKFAETKPLGERGLRWLKIHVANLYGYDKASFDERVLWTEARLTQIYASAENPLGTEPDNRWWRKADDPWQCLATCMELRHALNSPDPLLYESGHPVHQDGTCNGLQHYAALGGDATGAAQVNLSATDRPSDVYTYVGNMVEKKLAVDAAEGNKYAIMLTGKVTRKVVKQTVMTTVYGVTFIGARDQIEKQLKDRGDLLEEDCWLAASYLAKQTLTAIGDLFSGATSIQVWLNLCARIISKSIHESRVQAALEPGKKPGAGTLKRVAAHNRMKKEQMTSVIWTTVLGLPIVQPYRKTKRKQVTTGLQTVYLSDPNTPAEVDSMKQASAFPPNFIHSLDATHMMLTAIQCKRHGLTFASVHDSYWSHAGSIDKMSEIIRDTFIGLHSADVLVKLNDDFRSRYKEHKVPLSQMVTGTWKKQLYNAGTRIPVTREQAKSLHMISSLLVITDNETALEETEDAKRLHAYIEAARAEAERTGENPDQAVAALLDTNAEVSNLVSMLQSGTASVGKEKTEIEDSEEDEETMLAEEPEPEEEEEPVAIDPKLLKKRQTTRMSKSKAEQQAGLNLLGKFVDVNSLLPPLPQKGTFEVSQIKESPYFFS